MPKAPKTFGYAPPKFGSGLAIKLLLTVLIAGGIFTLLPLTQLLSGERPPQLQLTEVNVAMPPPPPPPPEPPPPEPEQTEEPPPEMQPPPTQLSVNQLEMALNPGMGDALAGALAFQGFGVQPDAVEQMKIFSIEDLDTLPNPVSRPIYPSHPRLERARASGSAKLQVVIDERGNVKVEEVISVSHRMWHDVFVQAASTLRFTPPMRNGQAVSVRYILPLSHSYN